MHYWHWKWFGVVMFLVVVQTAHGQSGTPRPIRADDANNLTLLTFLEEHSAPIAEMNFNPTSTAFLTGGLDGQLCVWNVEALGQVAGQVRLCLTGYQPGISRFAWTPDGNHLLVWWGEDSVIETYRISAVQASDKWATLRPTEQWSIGDLTPLSIEVLDSRHLLLIDIFNTLTLYDTELETISLSKRFIKYALLSGSDEILLLDEDGRLNVVNVAGGFVTTNLNLRAQNFALSPDASHLLTWGRKTQLWAVTDLAKSLLELDTQPVDAVFSPDEMLVATWQGETITLWNLATGQPTETLINHRGGVRILQFNADGRQLLTVSARGTGRFWVINSVGQVVAERWIDGEIDGIQLAADGETLILTRESFDGRFYNFSNGQLRGNADMISTQALFSPDWTLVAKVADNRVEWYGLREDERAFQWSPVGVASGIANVRPQPNQTLPRIAAIPTGRTVFARGRSADNEWVYVQLSNNLRGWVWAREIELNDSVVLDTLPIIAVEEEVEAE